jgi:hypothetical protein
MTITKGVDGEGNARQFAAAGFCQFPENVNTLAAQNTLALLSAGAACSEILLVVSS